MSGVLAGVWHSMVGISDGMGLVGLGLGWVWDLVGVGVGEGQAGIDMMRCMRLFVFGFVDWRVEGRGKRETRAWGEGVCSKKEDGMKRANVRLIRRTTLIGRTLNPIEASKRTN